MVFNHFSCAVGSPYVFFGEISIQIKSIQVWNLWHFYCVVFLLLSCSISLYIVDIKPLSHIYLHIFSPICVLSFHFLDGVVFSTEFQFQPKKAAFLPLDKMSCSLWQFLTNWVLRDLHLQVHLFHQGFCLPKSAKVGVKSGPLGKIQGSRVHTGNLGWLILLRITSLEKKKKESHHWWEVSVHRRAWTSGSPAKIPGHTASCVQYQQTSRNLFWMKMSPLHQN